MNRVRVVSERELGRDSDGRGRCARCCRWTEVHGHELRNRSHGGDPAHPDCLLCNPCNEKCENGDRRQMCFTGWKIDPRYPHDPVLQLGQARDINGDLVQFADYTTDIGETA